MEKNSNVLALNCGSKSFQIEHTKIELEKSQKLYTSLKSKLPDKGAKLKTRISDLENLLENLRLDAETVAEKSDEESVSKENEDRTNQLPKSTTPEIKNTTDHPPVKKDDPKKNLPTKRDDLAVKKDNTIKDVSSKSDVLFDTTNAVSFKELANKGAALAVNENNIQSPSFSGWRGGKTQLTEAKPLLEISSKKCLGYHVGSVKPVIDVNEESVKKIQHSLVTYPDENQEDSDPENLKTTMMTHQRRGLAWLVWREQQDPSGGILADDMGLGKTLTMISLILKQKENRNYLVSETEKNCTRGTLIVCLASIIHQWNDEISKHCYDDALDVQVYHGTKRDKDPLHMMRYDVVLTTYNIVMAEKKALIDKRVESPLFKLKWERIILDEAHTIKNHASQTANAIFSLRGIRKWAVTGTPIHNVFNDMYSLVHFLQFSPFDNREKFKKLTDDFSESSEKRKKLLVKSILLRRTKEQADEQGKPLIEMKDKSFTICYIELSERERKIYDKLNEKVTKKVDQYFLKHSKMKSSNLLVLLLRLQQCCSHVGLLGENVEDDDDIATDITKTLSSLTIDSSDSNSSSSESSLDLTLSGIDEENLSDTAVKSSKIKKLFEHLDEISSASDNKDKSVIVSQWVSMLDKVAYHLKQENIKYHLIAGSTKAEDRQKYMQDFNTTDNVKIMLLSLKAGGVGLNLTGANHLFLLDLHWNPALEMQACDRIHRVGQKKDVMIHKFICKNTIEERIKALQDKKRSIASDALHGSKQNTKGMTLDDFKALFLIRV